MNDSVRSVLFDFDYTLADPSGWVFDALRVGLSAVRLPVPNIVATKRLIGIPLEEQFKALGGSIDDQAMFRRFKSAYVEYRDAHANTETRFMEGVPETLRVLTDRGFLLGVVSTGAETRIRRILSSSGLNNHFQIVAGGCLDRANGIIGALAALGIPRIAAVYVGDRPDDGQAAAQAKVSFIAVLTGAFKSSDFPPRTELIHTMAELPERFAPRA